MGRGIRGSVLGVLLAAVSLPLGARAQAEAPVQAAESSLPVPPEMGITAEAASAEPTVAELVAELADPSVARRVAAIRMLGDRRAPEAVPALSSLLSSDPSPEARGWAVRSLSQIGTGEAHAALRQAAARDPDERVRSLAARASGTLPAAPAPQRVQAGRDWSELTVGGLPPLDMRGVPPQVVAEYRRRLLVDLTRPPGYRSSQGLLIATGVLDVCGLSIMLSGTVLPPLGFAGLFSMPMAIVDTAFLTAQQRAVIARGGDVDPAPAIAGWILTLVSFVGTWVGSHYWMAEGWGWYEEEVSARPVSISLITIAAAAEVANYFVRGIWWRREIANAHREAIYDGASEAEEDLVEE